MRKWPSYRTTATAGPDFCSGFKHFVYQKLAVMTTNFKVKKPRVILAFDS